MKIYKNIISDNKYELVLRNDSDEEFVIHYGGADLYWSMLDYCEDNRFVVTSDDGIFYAELDAVFNVIKESDNPYDKVLNDNCFVWLSEAYGLPEQAHKLIIRKENDSFCIEFVRNPENFSPVDTCFISFCLSGSRNQSIANAFSLMFLRFRASDIEDDKIQVLNRVK